MHFENHSHSKEVIKNFECDICKKHFSTNGVKNRHMKRHNKAFSSGDLKAENKSKGHSKQSFFQYS